VVGLYQGKLTEIESDVVVVADGSHSRLSHQLGLYNEDPNVVFYGARGYFEDIDEDDRLNRILLQRSVLSHRIYVGVPYVQNQG